jgi:hypothetical protein
MKTLEVVKLHGTKKLGIRFGDNDFYYTCTAFLKVLLPDGLFTHHLARDLKFTKAQIVELFNKMAPALYLLKQNAWRYSPMTDRGNGEGIGSYLRITEDKVYLDDEVDKFIVEYSGRANGDFFVVDFDKAFIWAL